MFGFGKQDEAAPRQATPSVSFDLRRPGVEFADVTTAEALDAAVAAGRLEWFWVTSPRFGGPEVPMNQLAGPPGAAAAKEQVDDQVQAALEAGLEVSADADIRYDDGPSRVARSVTFRHGAVGNHTLTFW